MSFLPLVSVLCLAAGFYRTPLLFAGFLAQCAYMFDRGMELGRLPIVGPHDTLFFMSASTILFSFPITHKMRERRSAHLPIIGLAIFFTVLSMFYRPHNAPLPPVLTTFWFETHVSLSFFAYALFGIAAVLGISILSRKRDDLEPIQYKSVLVGYLFFSTAMVFGGIWAYLAWGTYWLWTPKELWTVILWLFYSLYLHARLRSWWAGRPSVILGIAGFAIVMFTYLGVSLFMKSSHTF